MCFCSLAVDLRGQKYSLNFYTSEDPKPNPSLNLKTKSEPSNGPLNVCPKVRTSQNVLTLLVKVPTSNRKIKGPIPGSSGLHVEVSLVKALLPLFDHLCVRLMQSKFSFSLSGAFTNSAQTQTWREPSVCWNHRLF